MLIVKVGVSSWKVAPAVDERTFRIISFRVTSGDVTMEVEHKYSILFQFSALLMMSLD